MISKTLFCLLESLTNDEQSRLADYINSPFFNKDENVGRLYSFLQKKMKQKRMQNFDKKAVAKYVFPKLQAATAERKVTSLFKKIEQLILDFLVVLKREEHPKEDVTLLLNILNDRHIEAVWTKIWQKYGVKGNKVVNSNIDDFRYHYSLAKNWHEFAISDSKLKLETNLQDILIRFETYYVAQMLLYMCAALNSVRKSNESIDLPMLPAVLEIVEKRKLDETEPLIRCYKAIVLLLQTQKQQYFDELLLVLGNDVLQLEKAELSGIYTIAINYCIRRYNQGNVVFGEYVLDLYTEMLESDCLISNHYLEYMHFKNILFVALALKKHTWAKAFVVKYESRLNPDIRSDMKCYGEGLIAFREGKYEEAQLSFLQINNFNFVFHLNKEIYLLKIFYMSNGLLLESKLETLRSYLRQNKQLTAKTRKEYEFFYKKLKQLYRIKEQYDFLKNNPAKLEKVKKAAEKLLASIENERGVIVQGLWFRKQVEELLNKM